LALGIYKSRGEDRNWKIESACDDNGDETSFVNLDFIFASAIVLVLQIMSLEVG
jgi:hypothetical protein